RRARQQVHEGGPLDRGHFGIRLRRSSPQPSRSSGEHPGKRQFDLIPTHPSSLSGSRSDGSSLERRPLATRLATTTLQRQERQVLGGDNSSDKLPLANRAPRTSFKCFVGSSHNRRRDLQFWASDSFTVRSSQVTINTSLAPSAAMAFRS